MKGQKQLFSSESDEWTTPRDLFDVLNNKFNFQCDVAATKENALLPLYFTKEHSAIGKDWQYRNFCNPPYSNIAEFVEYAFAQSVYNRLTVMLLPARTDTKWFHIYIHNFWHVELLKGRLKFSNSKNSAPFPSMLVYFGIPA